MKLGNFVRIFDGSFPAQRSFTLGGDNLGISPTNFTWLREYGFADTKYTFFTDMHIEDALRYSDNVALLIEPPALHRGHYDRTIQFADEFDYILSFWKDFLEQFGEKGLFYPLGGSWISPINQHIPLKTKNICIIVSEKTGAEGHRMRHDTVQLLASRYHIDVYGRGYKPFERKAPILADYRYAIVIESWRGNDYFSEKLIDALSMGCVPIYCGCPNIGDYFRKDGIIRFDTLSKLENIIIQVVNEADYHMRAAAIKENFERCKKYQCAEDWIYDRYPFLFT